MKEIRSRGSFTQNQDDILENVIYKSSPFYPFRNELLKKEKEDNQKRRIANDIYTKIKDYYKEKQTELVSALHENNEDIARVLLGEDIGQDPVTPDGEH
jgi:hypothetical protein